MAPAKNKNRSDTPPESRGKSKTPVALLVATTGLFAYWNLFHELHRCFPSTDITFFSLTGGPLDGFLNCAVGPLGLATGSLIALALRRREAVMQGAFARKTLVPLLLLGAVPFAAVGLGGPWGFVLASHLAISVLIVFPFVFLFSNVATLGRQTMLLVTVASLIVSKVYGSWVVPAVVAGVGFSAGFVAGAFPLVCSLMAWDKTELPASLVPACATGAGETVQGRKAWRPLITHLAFYGFGLGLFHSMLGVGFGLGGNIRRSVDCVGTVLAALFALGTLRNLAFEEELWQKIRGVVFPLSIIGFLLIPVTDAYVLSAALEEFGLSYYNVLFAMGCFLMMRNTVLSPATIAAAGILFKSIGSFVGILLGAGLAMTDIAGNIQAVAIITIIVFSAFTLGTFWIGKDSELRKWWGLRRNYTAQQFRDQLIERKAAKLTHEHRLSQREQEILVKLAQGKRAQQISEECYISIYTVRNHTQNIYRKLGVHSFTELDALFAAIELSD